MGPKGKTRDCDCPDRRAGQQDRGGSQAVRIKKPFAPLAQRAQGADSIDAIAPIGREVPRTETVSFAQESAAVSKTELSRAETLVVARFRLSRSRKKKGRPDGRPFHV